MTAVVGCLKLGQTVFSVKVMSTDIPYIVNEGRKGGSNIAAAIVNALLYQMVER